MIFSEKFVFIYSGNPALTMALTQRPWNPGGRWYKLSTSHHPLEGAWGPHYGIMDEGGNREATKEVREEIKRAKLQYKNKIKERLGSNQWRS